MAKSTDNIAYAYAQALFEAAKEANVLPQIEAELGDLVGVVIHQRDASSNFFETPSVGFDEKAKVYRHVFAGRVHPMLLNFILTVVKHGRSPAMLLKCLEFFQAYHNALKGVAHLEVDSARKLEDAEMTQLKAVMSKMLNQKIEIKETILPELMGGFVVRHQNQQWDATVLSRFNRLKGELQGAKFPSSVLTD